MSLGKAFKRAFSLKCPACSKGKLFTSYIKIKPAESCSNCGLDFRSFDVGDAPAYFSVFIIGILIPVLAVVVDAYFTPALWAHIILWIPITLVFCYLSLIYIRAIFMHIEHEVKGKNK